MMPPNHQSDSKQNPNNDSALLPGNADLTANIGSKVSKSLVWMLGTSVLIKFLSFVAQVAMGWYLSDNDFGVFAIAFSIIGVCLFVREGGARDYLIQQGPARYKELVGPLFWMAMTITAGMIVVMLVGAGLLKAAPGLFPVSFRDSRLPWLLVLGGVLLSLSTPSSFTSAKLQLDLRFDTLGKVQIASGIVRYATMISLAAAGFGPFAFLLAWIAVAVFELVAFRRVVGINLFAEPKSPHLWRGFIILTGWLAVGFFGNFLVEWGNSAGVGLFSSAANVGYYYFAFSLTVQLVILLSVNAQQVLMPALSRLNTEPARQSQAILRVTRAMVLVASGLCLGFSVAADSVLTVIWHGKWEPAVLAVQIFGIFFPMRMTYGLTLAILQAKGQFKRWAITSVIEATLMFAAATFGGWYAPGAEWPALFVGIVLVFGRSYITAMVLKQAGIGTRDRVAAQFPAWALAIGAAGAVWALDIYIGSHGGWDDLRAWLLQHAHLNHGWGGIAMEILRGGSLAAAFGLLYSLLIRVLMPGAVAEAIAIAPRKMRGLAARLAFINLQPAAVAEQAAAETQAGSSDPR